MHMTGKGQRRASEHLGCDQGKALGERRGGEKRMRGAEGSGRLAKTPMVKGEESRGASGFVLVMQGGHLHMIKALKASETSVRCRSSPVKRTPLRPGKLGLVNSIDARSR